MNCTIPAFVGWLVRTALGWMKDEKIDKSTNDYQNYTCLEQTRCGMGQNAIATQNNSQVTQTFLWLTSFEEQNEWVLAI